MLKKYFLLFGLLLIHAVVLKAYNQKQLSSKDGLSNSSIFGICQDSDGFMWFGSADGLNMYDGTNITVFKPSSNRAYSLAGNMIDGIIEAQPGVLWIATNYGFNKLDKKTKRTETHSQFEGMYRFNKSPNNDIYAIHEDNAIEYYNPDKREFISLSYPKIVSREIVTFFIDENNIIWIFSYNGQITNAQIVMKNKIPTFKILNNFKNDIPINFCSYKGNNKALFTDVNCNLYELNTKTRKKYFIKNLKEELDSKGNISAITYDNDDFLVGFHTNGLIRLKHTPENESRYKIEPTNIHCGILFLLKDKNQDITWVGTDGQGVFMYSHNSFSMKTTTFYDLPVKIQKPIRAVFIDETNNLWIGTRNDGILKTANYDPDKKITAESTEVITTDKGLLIHNSNYVITSSRNKNIFWIGGDGPGLNYYSYKENRIKRVGYLDNNKIEYVHEICEVNDSVLWIASGGDGLYKVKIAWNNNEPKIAHIDNIRFRKEDKMTNYFFSICQENDSILWFGNRRNGAIRMNILTNKFDYVSFDDNEARTINDVLCMHKDKHGRIWFGSSYGITYLKSFSKEGIKFHNYNEKHGLPNNTIHSIEEDNNGNLWLSTNRGLVEFDPSNETFRIYDSRDGIDVFEYSDGASYTDPKTGIMIFGGQNGFVTIKQDSFTKDEFVPPIYFTGIKIYERNFNIHDLIREDRDGEYIELEYDQNFFSISFVALDYLIGQNNKYYYNLENFSSKWINNGNSNSVTFTNIAPGEYTLHVSCKNGEHQSSKVYSLKIIILPPWYLTSWAYIVYLIMTALILYYIFKLLAKRYKKKKENILEKMNQQQKEEIYESKLRFFTNITHELCTPLTLIYGPCERIISYNGSDKYIKKYAGLIQKNTEHLNSLIQELIEFRRIETGHKNCEIRTVNITDFSQNILDSFQELAESKSIDFKMLIEDNILWNTDKSFFSKILTNLVSNAFKYTQDSGGIEVKIYVDNDLLEINVSNTGKGIKEKDISLIFDRYSILEHLEMHTTSRGITARNGLGLAICHNLVKLLNGDIKVHSIPNEVTTFKVVFPTLENNGNGLHTNDQRDETVDVLLHTLNDTTNIDADTEHVLEISENNERLKGRPTILAIDDDPDILFFISEIFQDQYNVISVENSTKVFDVLEQIQPNVIISDVMMPGIDGISLAKELKSNKRTSYIPLIILSAKITPEDQTEGIEAGAEIYVTKPFSVEYLKSVIERLIQRQNDLKEYYSSAMSAFEINKGQLVHKEDKKFFDKMLAIIEAQALDPSFTTESLASELGLSSRHLYRKLASISVPPPGELIKEYRLTVVEKLLVSTKLSVDEIMYKTGYSNRGNFYKVFYSKFEMTPKAYREQKNAKQF